MTKKAHIVSVDMGYGHQRAAYALRDLCGGEVFVANNYRGIPKKDKSLWNKVRIFYETISRLKPIPVIGDVIFEVVDKQQTIPLFYPRRDLSRPTVQVKQIYHSIRKHGFQKDVIDTLRKNPLPMVCTFFSPAFAAEEFDYPGDIYLVITDADCSRAWVALDPKRSRIKYFAPNGRVVERLKLYGVRAENIYLTGFPLPKELIGGPEAREIRDDIGARLCNLDPNGIFRNKYRRTLESHLGDEFQKCMRKRHPLALTFLVGGAGAQRELGITIVKSLSKPIQNKEIRVNLISGARKGVADYYKDEIKKIGLGKFLGEWVHIQYNKDKWEYFKEFSELLHTTDIIWTKPSEMSFYTGLGFPIIMAPPIGSQEEFNRIWLKSVGGGVSQNNPEYTNEWLFDWINSGGLARMAWNGFIEAPTHGAFRIEQIITGKPFKLEKLPLIV